MSRWDLFEKGIVRMGVVLEPAFEYLYEHTEVLLMLVIAPIDKRKVIRWPLTVLFEDFKVIIWLGQTLDFG